MECLVMLVSDQTMPNLTFLSHFKIKEETKLIFLTTQQMRDIGKVQAIISALKYEQSYEEITLEPENLQENLNILKERIGYDNAKFIINLTCGNKIMTLSAYSFFSGIKDVSMYYLPINSNTFTLIYPNDRRESFTPEYLSSIEDILKSYNIDIHSSSSPLFDYETALRFYDLYHNVISPNLRRGFIVLRNLYHSHKKLRIRFVDNVYDYPDKILIELKKLHIDKVDITNVLRLLFSDKVPDEILKTQKINTVYIDYISGGWFEEYIYFSLLKIEPQDILLNIKAVNLLNNEFDVFMLKNNILYFIECKTSVMTPQGSIINDTLYKLDSVSHPAGLTVRKLLMCLDESLLGKEPVRLRAKQTRISIIDGSRLKPDRIVEEFMRL